jgi:acetyl esterase/lipase
LNDIRQTAREREATTMSQHGKTVGWLVALAWLGALASWSAPQARMDGAHAAAMPAGVVAPAGTRQLRDVAYGDDPLQRYDVYAPAGAHDAPVIVMVHGGGWRRGDKAMPGVVVNKLARWGARGFVVVSVNYRLLPRADLHAQLDDVARALASVQRRAAEWGGDGRRVVLMGHSAGAHLVALLAARPSLAFGRGASPWLGTVVLDSAALDVPAIMQGPHFPLYDHAFGHDPAQWTALSPLQQLQARGAPVLAVCSSRRLESCPSAQRFAARANALGTRAEVLEEDLGHGEINRELGLDSQYTRRVERFLAGLDPRVAQLLGQPAARVRGGVDGALR